MTRQYDPHLIDIDIGKLWVPKDDDLGMERDGTFLEAANEKAFMKKHIKEGDIFCDIGAHVGYFSIYAFQLGADYIEAFEPHPFSFGLLTKNFLFHNLRGMAWDHAVGNELGTISLWESNNNTGDHMIGNGGPTHALYGPASIVSLDLISDLRPPDFIKIDVQGSEPRVIDGAKALILTERPTIMIEYSPWHLECQGFDSHKFLDELYKLPYDIECSYGDPYELESPGYTTLYMEAIL